MNFQGYERNLDHVLDHVCSTTSPREQYGHEGEDLDEAYDDLLDVSYDDEWDARGNGSSSSSPNSNSGKRRGVKGAVANGATGGAAAASTPKKKQYKSTNKFMEKTGWLGRQISAAYDEHASIIQKLRKELDESKQREQALVQEFSNKYQELQKKQKNGKVDQQQQQSKVQPRQHQKNGRHATATADSAFEDNDMPMDEMADTARSERNARSMEIKEQKRVMAEFKQQSDAQMEKLRTNSEKQIKAIEKALKEKVHEIDLLRKESSFCKQQGENKGSGVGGSSSEKTPTKSTKTVATVISPGVISLDDDSSNDEESIPIHSFIMKDHSSLLSSMNNSNNSVPESNTNSPESTSRNLFTPEEKAMINLTGTKSTGTKSTRSMGSDEDEASSPQTARKCINFENSVAAMDGSAFESKHDDSNSLKSRSLNMMSSSPSLSSSSSNSRMQRILQVIEMNNDRSNKQRETSSCQDFNHDETLFIDNVQKLIQNVNKRQEKAITSLMMKLQESNKEIQLGASKALQMKKRMNELEIENKYVQNHLNSAQASIRNTSNLEDMLKIITNDRESDSDIKEKVAVLEMENEVLVRERNGLKEDVENSVGAIRRVMADVTLAKDAQIEVLTNEVGELKEQVRLWKIKNKGALDRSSVMPVIVEQCDLKRLRDEADKCRVLTEDIQILRTELEESKSKMHQLQNNSDSKEKIKKFRSTIDKLQKENVKLDIQLKNNYIYSEKEISKAKDTSSQEVAEYEKRVSVILEEKMKLTETIAKLKKQNKHYKDEVKNSEDVLRAVKGAHKREQKLEEELSELHNLFDNATKQKTSLKNDLRQKDDEIEHLKKDFHQRLISLQSQINELKAENCEITMNATKAEDTAKRTCRVLALMEEAGGSEDSAPQIVLDMKENLREHLDVMDRLRQSCNDGDHHYLEKMTDGINTTLCLLEAAVYRTSLFSQKGVSDIKHWGESTSKEIANIQNQMMRNEVEVEIREEKEQEILLLNLELNRFKRKSEEYIKILSQKEESERKNEEYLKILSQKDEEMNVLRSSLKETSVGYISGDESDLDAEPNASNNLPLHIGRPTHTPEQIEELLKAKEATEAASKQNAERLANAKMIISSLEKSNKSMTQDLKSRLNDSNAAIVNLVDESGALRSKLNQLKTEKDAIETQLCVMKSTHSPTKISLTKVISKDDSANLVKESHSPTKKSLTKVISNDDSANHVKTSGSEEEKKSEKTEDESIDENSLEEDEIMM